MTRGVALYRRFPALTAVGGVLALLLVLVLLGKASVVLGPWSLVLPLLPLAGWAALRYPSFVIYTLAFTSPLTSGMARGALIPFFRPNELILVTLVYVAAVTFLVRRRTIRLTWIDGVLGVFLFFRCLLPALVMIIRGEPWSVFALKTLFGPIQYYLVFRMAMECVETKSQVRTALFLMMLSSGVVAGVGILQALQIPGINGFLETWYPSEKHLYTFTFASRVTSLWAGDWNGCGLYMAMSAVLGLGTAHLFSDRRLRGAVLLIAILDLLVVFLTASFTGAICLFFGLFVLVLRNPQARGIVRPLLVAAPILGVVLGRIFWSIISQRFDVQFSQVATSWVPLSFQVRMRMWREQMWPWVERYWVWGLGPYRQGWPYEESYYMFLILKAGVFGVASYAFLVVSMLLRLGPYLRRTRVLEGSLAMVVWIHYLQVVIANVSGSYFEFNGVSELLWLLPGFLMALEHGGGNSPLLEPGTGEDPEPGDSPQAGMVPTG